MAEHRTSRTLARSPAVVFDQDAAAPARVSFRRSFRLRSWLLPGFVVANTTLNWVLGDHLPVVRGFGVVAALWLAVFFLQCRLTEASADEHGLWRRYRWLTTWLGWQQHWAWSEIASVSTSDQDLTLRTLRGRTAELVPATGSNRDDDRLAEFARQVEALAVLAGVPVVPPPTWRERRRLRAERRSEAGR